MPAWASCGEGVALDGWARRRSYVCRAEGGAGGDGGVDRRRKVGGAAVGEVNVASVGIAWRRAGLEISRAGVRQTRASVSSRTDGAVGISFVVKVGRRAVDDSIRSDRER